MATVELNSNNVIVEVLPTPQQIIEVAVPQTVVVEVSEVGPQGPPGTAGFIALPGNTPVPPGTPAGVVILRY